MKIKILKILSLLYVAIINPILIRICNDTELDGCCCILAIVCGLILLMKNEELEIDYYEK